MLAEILISILIGIIFGTITGMIPGIHINLIGVGLISIHSFLFQNVLRKNQKRGQNPNG